MPGWARSAPSSSAKRETVTVQCSSTLPPQTLSTGRASPPVQTPLTRAGVRAESAGAGTFLRTAPRWQARVCPKEAPALGAVQGVSAVPRLPAGSLPVDRILQAQLPSPRGPVSPGEPRTTLRRRLCRLEAWYYPWPVPPHWTPAVTVLLRILVHLRSLLSIFHFLLLGEHPRFWH